MDSFSSMHGGDFLAAVQIGDRARYFKTLSYARAERPSFSKAALRSFRPGSLSRHTSWLIGRNTGVAGKAHTCVALLLQLTGPIYPLPYNGRGLGFLGGRKLFEIHRRHFNMEIQPIQQRAADTGKIAVYSLWSTNTGSGLDGRNTHRGMGSWPPPA